MPDLSVILCTHNPRPDYLKRSLDALANQTLPTDKWEFIIVDNASTTPITDCGPLSSHPKSRIIREDALGLLNARLTGFQNSVGSLLVLVDDDNVLDPKYLEIAEKISTNWPFLGAWGGQCIGVFESTPPQWTEKYLPWLTIKQFKDVRWSNSQVQSESTPGGAGMCVRRSVVDHYVQHVRSHPLRMLLGRKGDDLAGSEDIDLCLSGVDIGLGTGQFPELQLQHLISPKRYSESYLLKICEMTHYCISILHYIHGQLITPRRSRAQWLLERYQRLWIDSRERKFIEAADRGLEKARTVVAEYEMRLATD